MRSNAPIVYTLVQAGVFVVIFSLVLAAQYTSISVPFCAQDYAFQTGIYVFKAATFCAVLHLPGAVTASRFGGVDWRWSLLPMILGQSFVFVMFANDIGLQFDAQALCATNPDFAQARSIFLPKVSLPAFETLSTFLSYAWGLSILFVLSKLVFSPAIPLEE